jgi:hypothetical protein
MRSTAVVPPEATADTDTDTALVGAALAVPAMPVEKPTRTMAAAVMNTALRASRLMRIVPPE